MMSKEKRFLRKCVGCGEYKKKEDLIKITSEHNSGEIFVNPNSSVFGRSCYICRDENCINKAFRKLKIAKIMKRNVNSDLKETIMTVLES